MRSLGQKYWYRNAHKIYHDNTPSKSTLVKTIKLLIQSSIGVVFLNKNANITIAHKICKHYLQEIIIMVWVVNEFHTTQAGDMSLAYAE